MKIYLICILAAVVLGWFAVDVVQDAILSIQIAKGAL